jgi:putative PIN family toxin of toxin-antitoxin system
VNIVIDTNVFVSSFFGGNARRIIDLWKNRQVRLCLSKAILDEYVDVLQRMGLKDQRELKELLSLFAKGYHLNFTAKTPHIKVVQEDPDDDKFIECAVALHAEVIVTGDKALKAIRDYMGTRILTPQEFLRWYEKQGM